MGEIISTIFDPLGFGFGEAVTGKGSAITNISHALGYMGGDKNSNNPAGGNQPNEPTKPSLDTASQDAKDEMTKSRRALLASGGETNLTGIGGAPLLGTNLSHAQLLGG